MQTEETFRPPISRSPRAAAYLAGTSAIPALLQIDANSAAMREDGSRKNEVRPIYCDTREAARLLGVSPSFLEKARHFRTPGPPFIRVGRAVRYPVAGLREWAEARTQGGAK